jgi:hypothetical protein
VRISPATAKYKLPIQPMAHPESTTPGESTPTDVQSQTTRFRECRFDFFPFNSQSFFELDPQRRRAKRAKRITSYVRSGTQLPRSVTCSRPAIHGKRGIVETPCTGESYFVEPNRAERGTIVVIGPVQHYGICGRTVTSDFGRDPAHVLRTVRRDSLCGH